MGYADKRGKQGSTQQNSCPHTVKKSGGDLWKKLSQDATGWKSSRKNGEFLTEKGEESGTKKQNQKSYQYNLKNKLYYRWLNILKKWTPYDRKNYYNSNVQAELFALPETLQGKYVRLTERMEIFGANLGEPHTKAFGDGLFELRLKGAEGIARVFYCTLVGQKIVMLHSFIKKTQKTPIQTVALIRRC